MKYVPYVDGSSLDEVRFENSKRAAPSLRKSVLRLGGFIRRRDGARRGVEEVREPDALEARARRRVAPEGLEPERALERGRGGRAGPHANARVSSRVVFV